MVAFFALNVLELNDAGRSAALWAGGEVNAHAAPVCAGKMSGRNSCDEMPVARETSATRCAGIFFWHHRVTVDLSTFITPARRVLFILWRSSTASRFACSMADIVAQLATIVNTKNGATR